MTDTLWMPTIFGMTIIKKNTLYFIEIYTEASIMELIQNFSEINGLGGLYSFATVAQRVTHLSRNSEDVDLNPGTGRYFVARMTT